MKEVTHRQTGEKRLAYIPIEVGRKRSINTDAKPYPSEAEAMQLAAVEAAQNEGRVQASPALRKILDAAVKSADTRESYIPQDPRKK